MNGENAIVEYVRDDNNNPIGVVAAQKMMVDNKEIIGVGWSKLNPKDKFTKNRGKTIAIGRSSYYDIEEAIEKVDSHVPHKDVTLFQDKLYKIYNHAMRYYHGDKTTV